LSAIRERYESVSAPAPDAGDRVENILQAACRVVLRDGAHGLRIAAVAREAGVSKALVHYYFPTRQELLRGAFAYSGEQRDEAVASELGRATSGVRRVERFLLASVDPAEPFGKHRALWNEVWSSLRVDAELRPLVHDAYEAWVGQVVRLIEGARSDGSVPQTIDARAAGWRLAAVVDGLDSMLYLDLVDRGRARRLVRQSLERELAT
jgi:TetR/AcrR family transcriptional regulator, regulator of cefoperazone and chloramphenicol sensitivity